MSALFPPVCSAKDVVDSLIPPADDETAMELGTGGLPIGSVSDAELAKQYDLIVIGGGPAGIAGALKAAQMGKRTLVVDRPKAAPADGGLDYGFGGPTGLFSKAMRDVGKTLDIESLETMGLDNDVVWRQVRNNCLKLAKNNAINCIQTLDVFRVGYLQGEATIVPTDDGKATLRIKKHANGEMVDVTGKKVLLCTGSTPLRLPGTPFDGLRVFDSDSINGLGFLPRSVTIVGSGIIAIEYAKIFRKYGADVTMLVRGNAKSALQKIGIDETIAERLLGALATDNIKVMEDTSIKQFTYVPETVCDTGSDDIGGNSCEPIEIELVDGEKNPKGTLFTEVFMAATGRVPVTKGTVLGLEEAGIELGQRGHIHVNEKMCTSVPYIYSAGDCIAGPALASTGVDQAQRAVEYMFSGPNKVVEVADDFPIGMWTTPEVGYYGMTKQAAIKAGFDAEEGIAQYDKCLRGRVFAPDGMLKLVFDRESKRILGVHIIGTDACELVHYGMDLVEKQATIFDVIGTLFTAVTFHELFKEAAFDGNSKLEFGIQWQEVLSELSVGLMGSDELSEADLRAKFDEIDTSGDGELDTEELAQVFVNIGAPVAEEVIENLVHLADEDGNGTIDWDEFVNIFEVLNTMKAKQAI